MLHRQTKTSSWVILFGGAGRQNVIFDMIKSGLSILKVIIPKKKNQKLEEAAAFLRDLGLDLVEAGKKNIEDCLAPYTDYPILSLGFPLIIPKSVFEKHPLALNVHPTLLPKYRGISSGAYIIINGEKKSGSTVHVMTEEADKGEIVLQREVPLSPFDTIRSMQKKVYSIEPQLVVDAIEQINQGIPFIEQNEAEASSFPKPRKPNDSEIDPSKPLFDLINEIRACDPENFPAFFLYHGQKVAVKLWRLDSNNKAHVDEI